MTPSHVTNLSLSKRLREVGVPQKSLFYWIRYDYEDKDGAYVGNGKGIEQWEIEHRESVWNKTDVSAFLASELGELLPKKIQWEVGNETKCDKSYYCRVGFPHRSPHSSHVVYAPTLPNAIGLMLMWLKENGLLKD